MNDKQWKWTKARCNELGIYLKTNSPLSQGQWDSVGGYIEIIVSLSGSSKEINAEVRSALFDVVEPYERKEQERKFANEAAGK